MTQLWNMRNDIRIRLISADLWHSLSYLNEQNIPVSNLHMIDALTCELDIQRKLLPPVKSSLEKRGDSVKTLPSKIASPIRSFIRKRPVLIAGLCVILVLNLFLPSRILLVACEGHERIPGRMILEAAEQAGIRIGASREAVRSERMKNALLSVIPELQWAGVNTYGCKAVISVRESPVVAQDQPSAHTVSSIIAGRDGVIRSVTVQSGSAVAAEGQAVQKGEILISGFTDCGISIRAANAQGEVFAQTKHTMQSVIPSEYLQKVTAGRTSHALSIVLGKKRINLWKDSGIWDSSCGRISRDYPVKLPGGFCLPIVLSVETLTVPELQSDTYSTEFAAASLGAFSENYLANQMIAGSIEQASTALDSLPGCFRLNGTYHCVEMIGRAHLEIGVPHE